MPTIRVPPSRLYRPGDLRRGLSARTDGEEPAWRSPFRRDLGRLTHSASFRRLQGKTQLFAGLESDFFRNRLTHSLEVAQIARTLALKLNADGLAAADSAIDLDLVELAALAHDLGHPPFGHTGEEVLDGLMREAGGFEGNAQTLRILARLEKKLDDPGEQLAGDSPRWYRDGRDAGHGLNLCSRSLAAVLKYDREIPWRRPPDAGLVKGYYASESAVVERVRRDVTAGAGGPIAVVECGIMDLADDIAYSTYDLEDAFKGGLLNPLDLLFAADEVLERVAARTARELGGACSAADVGDVLRELFAAFGEPAPGAGAGAGDYLRQLGQSYTAALDFARDGFFRNALTSSLVNRFVAAVGVDFDAADPPRSRVRMGASERRQVAVLKHLTYVLLTASPRLKLVAHRGEAVVRTIFAALAGSGATLLPADLADRYAQADERGRRRVVCDFIAGMTDRYAVELYARLSSETFYSMFKPL